jgi:hypothetical protein
MPADEPNPVGRHDHIVVPPERQGQGGIAVCSFFCHP